LHALSFVLCLLARLAACLVACVGRQIWPIWINTRLETTAMVPFFVQIKCKLGQSYAVANALAEAEIASEIYSTAGQYDLLVKFYVDNDTDIGHFVNEKVQVLPGIQDTLTIITFKAFGPG
jgi:DNA-binding Lrp family transcriptional regulator